MASMVSAFAAMLGIVPYFAAALALFFLGKFVFDLSTPGIKDDEELTKKDNPAFGVLFVGYMLGLAIALAGTFSSLGPSVLDNVLDLGTSGLAAILLMRLSMALGEALILPGLRLESQIVAERNIGAGFAFAGLLVANGFIISGVMQGRSDSYLVELLDIGVYWAAGQAFLLLAWLLYRAIANLGSRSRFDVRKDIGEGKNTAAGISIGGFLVAAGLVLQAALAGSGSDIGAELLVTIAVGACGLVLLAAARVLSALVLLPNADLADEVSRQGNVAAGAVSALSFVAVAAIFAALVRSQLG
jgi:uncharacterized membrane protein YjfL (UPF0719 family)